MKRWILWGLIIGCLFLVVPAGADGQTPDAGGQEKAVVTVTTKLVPDVGLERGGKSPAVEIFIDGKPTGFTAPHTFVLNPGQRYELRGKARGYTDDFRKISFAPGEHNFQLSLRLNSFSFILYVFPALLWGALLTLGLTVVAVFNGIIIGTLVGIGRVIKSKVVNLIAGFYTDFIRGTPLLVQIFMFHFGLPPLLGLLTGTDAVYVPAIISAIVTLSINSGAYVAEIVRAGIQSIDRGQMEAARSLGLTYRQALRHVILPQAFKRVIPPLGNEFIAMLKDSSLVSVIAMEELVRTGQLLQGRFYRSTEIWLAVAIIFLCMTLPFTRLVAMLERRMKTGD